MFKLRFLGTGNSYAISLGNSSAVLEINNQPRLLIDCGHTVPDAYRKVYGAVIPEAIFITHTHSDHVAGLEPLFHQLSNADPTKPSVKLFIPVPLVMRLQHLFADKHHKLGRSRNNFWDCFQLIPVSGHFWHFNQLFDVFTVQHHAPQSAFGLALANHFLYTGDTRPIPDVLARYAAQDECIFHDCAANKNPAHTWLADLSLAYTDTQRQRMVLYHQESSEAVEQLRQQGYRVAKAGDCFDLPGC